MLEPGAILQGRYQVIAPVGKGGMGSVYRARDLRLRTDVALKETLFSDDVYRRAFEHEAQVLARLRHQALPRVIDHFIEGQGQFLVMEFIHGEDLGTQLARLGPRFASPQAMPTILRWADQLLDALHYLHTRPVPVYHRDIKPKNLKLTPSYDIILLDFGLARGGMTVSAPPEAPTSPGDQRKIYGFTPPYAPIEQMRDGEPDARSDLYSLAATLYHLLTGALPADAMARMARIANGQPDPLRPVRALAPHVPEAVDELLRRAMAVMIEDRPASAREMRVELARARAALAGARAGAGAAPRPAAPAQGAASPPPVEGLTHGLTAFPGSITPSTPGAAPEATPAGTLQRMLTTGSPVRSVAFSPSGELLAAGYDDHTIGLWRLRDYSHVATLRGHNSSVRSVRFAPQGGLLATGSDDETVRLWQVGDGAGLRHLHVPSCPIESIAFSPDGRLLAVGGWGGAITLCHVEGGHLSVSDALTCPFVHSLSFSPDGSLLAAGCYDGMVYLWSMADNVPLPPLPAFSTFVLAVAFSPDGSCLAASSSAGVRLWRTGDYTPIDLLQGHSGPVHAIAFSPDGQTLATGSADKSVRLWRVSNSAMIPIPLEHRGGVASLSFSPDGRTLATGSHDGRICLWTVGA